jgi:hypothetical protein
LIFAGSAMLVPNAFGICTSLPYDDGFIVSDEHHYFVDIIGCSYCICHVYHI